MSQKYKPTTLLDIIIPVYNRSDLLKRCLEYIPNACKDIEYQIYVFDNGSTVPHGMVGAQAAPPINEAANIRECCESAKGIYIRNGQNVGFPMACNRAFKKGTSPLVFFLNDDVFLMEESVNKLVKDMDNPKVGVVGMKLLFPLDSQDSTRPAGKIQHVGISTNIRGQFFHQFMGWSPENPRTLRLKNPYAVTGAAMMTRRKLFREAGGFFEGYGMGTYEDVDYCMTIHEMGYNIITDHEAVAFHLTGATAVSQNVSYPLGHNFDLFKLRWKEKVTYTEWEAW